MIELDTPEGQQRLREYYEAIGLQVALVDGCYSVRPADCPILPTALYGEPAER